MTRKTIGILGASGSVGRGVLQAFSRDQCDFLLLLGVRNIELLKELIPKERFNTEIREVDVKDKKALEEFCAQCSIVINCTAPASTIGTVVVEECIRQEISYIDPYGLEDVKKKIMEREDKILKRHYTMITSAGAYPGLTEFLASSVINECSNEVIEIKEYFSGNGSFSERAAIDIVSDITGKNGNAFCHYSNGTVIKSAMNNSEKIALPAPTGEVYAYPIINNNFFHVCKRDQIQNGFFYNTFGNMEIMARFFEMSIRLKYGEDIKAEDAARQIRSVYEKYKAKELYTMYTFFIRRSNGQVKRIIFLYEGDWNILTGKVCAALAKIINDKKIPVLGYRDFGEFLPYPIIMEELMKIGLQIRVE